MLANPAVGAANSPFFSLTPATNTSGYFDDDKIFQFLPRDVYDNGGFLTIGALIGQHRTDDKNSIIGGPSFSFQGNLSPLGGIPFSIRTAFFSLNDRSAYSMGFDLGLLKVGPLLVDAGVRMYQSQSLQITNSGFLRWQNNFDFGYSVGISKAFGDQVVIRASYEDVVAPTIFIEAGINVKTLGRYINLF